MSEDEKIEGWIIYDFYYNEVKGGKIFTSAEAASLALSVFKSGHHLKVRPVLVILKD